VKTPEHDDVEELRAAAYRCARAILGQDRYGEEPQPEFPSTLDDIVALMRQGPELAHLILRLDARLRSGAAPPLAWQPHEIAKRSREDKKPTRRRKK